MNEKKREVIFVDIDGTICRTEGGYENAKPIPENIVTGKQIGRAHV